MKLWRFTASQLEAGRGQKLLPSPVAQWAIAHNIPVETPASLKAKAAQEQFASYKAEVAVVAAYGLILPPAILAAPTKGCLNIHASLLPRWRGAAPIHHAIWAGDKETGVCIMQMDAGLDTGAVLSRESVEIGQHNTSSLHDVLAAMGAGLIVKTLQNMPAPIPQPEEGVTYAHKVNKAQGQLDFSKTAEELERQIRAFTHWPGAWFLHNNERIKVTDAEVVPLQTSEPTGKIQGDLTIVCGENSLKIKQLQKPGGRLLSAKNFLNGHDITMKNCKN